VQHQIERRVQAELGELALCGRGNFQRCAQFNVAIFAKTLWQGISRSCLFYAI
jgi:hypothetical protein